MNPKNALFLSASLTAFVLAVLFGVVTKVTTTPTVAAAALVAQVVAATMVPNTETPTQEVLPSATVAGPLGPEEAAALAAKALGSEDVYSVETFSYKGTTDSFKVVFGSGAIVYMGLDRQVLEIGKLPPVVVNVSAATTKPTKKHRDDNNSSGSSNQQPPVPAPEPTEAHDD